MPELITISDRYSTRVPCKQDAVTDVRKELLNARATECANRMVWLPRIKSSPYFLYRLRRLNRALQLVFASVDSPSNSNRLPMGERRLCENLGLLRSALASLEDAKDALTRTAYVRCSGHVVPRVLVIAEDLLATLDYGFKDSEFSAYMQAFQSTVVLRLDELRSIVPALRCVLLERLAECSLPVESNGSRLAANGTNGTVETYVRSLREIDQAPWRELLGTADRFRCSVASRSGRSLRAHGFGEPRDVSWHGCEAGEILRPFGARNCGTRPVTRSQIAARWRRRSGSGAAAGTCRLLLDRRRRTGTPPSCSCAASLSRALAALSAPVSQRVLSWEASSS